MRLKKLPGVKPKIAAGLVSTRDTQVGTLRAILDGCIIGRKDAARDSSQLHGLASMGAKPYRVGGCAKRCDKMRFPF